LLAWQRTLSDNPDVGRRAFVLGALTHVLEIDHSHRASIIHPDFEFSQQPGF